MTRLNWIALTWLALLCGAGLEVTGHAVAIDGTLVQAAGIVALLALIGRHVSYAPLSAVLTAMSQLSLCWMATVPLNFMTASYALPLQDAALASADRALGFDWPAMYAFCTARPALMSYAALFYGLIGVFGTAVPVVLGFADRPRLFRFVGALIITVVVTGIVTVFVPAMGTYSFLGLDAHAEGLTASGYLDQLKVLPSVRDGSLRVLELGKLEGIITFPSFHAASAVLSTWALWSVRWLRPVVAIGAGGMLLATPLCGGHYFSDVLAGVAVSVFAIIIVNRSNHGADA